MADVVRRNFYVDDLLKSTTTVEQAIDLSLKLISLLQEGGFRLTKFLSNRREVLQAIPEKERAAPKLDLDLDQLPINRTLGLCWDAETDEFYFTSVSTEKPATKRGILSVLSSLFDPLGFLNLLLMSYQSKLSFRNFGGTKEVGTMKYKSSNLQYGNCGLSHCLSCLKLGLQDVISTRT